MLLLLLIHGPLLFYLRGRRGRESIRKVFAPWEGFKNLYSEMQFSGKMSYFDEYLQTMFGKVSKSHERIAFAVLITLYLAVHLRLL